jgi:hypothetical protein
MGEFKSALKPYDVEAALAGDRGEDCLVIDVGRDEAGRAIPSLKHVSEQVERYLQHARSSTFAATKLYLIGKWNLTPPEYVVEDEWNKNEIEVSIFSSMFDIIQTITSYGAYVNTN